MFVSDLIKELLQYTLIIMSIIVLLNLVTYIIMMPAQSVLNNIIKKNKMKLTKDKFTC